MARECSNEKCRTLISTGSGRKSHRCAKCVRLNLGSRKIKVLDLFSNKGGFSQ